MAYTDWNIQQQSILDHKYRFIIIVEQETRSTILYIRNIDLVQPLQDELNHLAMRIRNMLQILEKSYSK